METENSNVTKAEEFKLQANEAFNGNKYSDIYFVIPPPLPPKKKENFLMM